MNDSGFERGRSVESWSEEAVVQRRSPLLNSAEPEQYPWSDVKSFGELPKRAAYPADGTHGVPRRARAFSCNSSLRITATNATFPGFPCWRRF